MYEEKTAHMLLLWKKKKSCSWIAFPLQLNGKLKFRRKKVKVSVTQNKPQVEIPTVTVDACSRLYFWFKRH